MEVVGSGGLPGGDSVSSVDEYEMPGSGAPGGGVETITDFHQDRT